MLDALIWFSAVLLVLLIAQRYAPPNDIIPCQRLTGSTLDLLTLFACTLVMVLVAAKYGALEVASFVLAIIALVPFIGSAYLYFTKAPGLKYQLASKNKTKEAEDRYVYDLMFGVRPVKGRILLRRLVMGTEFEILPERHPGSTEPIRFVPYLLPRGEVQEAITAIITGSDYQPVDEKGGYVHLLRFVSRHDVDSFRVRFGADLQVDPFDLGVFALLQALFGYRYEVTIVADFKDLSGQEGQLRRL
jgi:hypothetical protein